MKVTGKLTRSARSRRRRVYQLRCRITIVPASALSVSSRVPRCRREHVEVFEPRGFEGPAQAHRRIRAIVRLIEIQSAGRRRFSLCNIGCSPSSFKPKVILPLVYQRQCVVSAFFAHPSVAWVVEIAKACQAIRATLRKLSTRCFPRTSGAHSIVASGRRARDSSTAVAKKAQRTPPVLCRLISRSS